MARGKKCPQCGHQMYATAERQEPAGAWVIYQCRNQACRFEEKVFEGK
jgi:hypothetical protein